MGEAKIDVRGVSLAYRLRDGRSVEALEEVSFQVPENDFFVLLGPSGCGKSTLLNVIGGLVKADKGGVLLDGTPIAAPDPQRVAIMFQDPLLLPWRTVTKNIEFGLEPRRIPKHERETRALKYLKLVGLEGFADAYPHQLSGGMKQRVALCRALAMETEIVLMDEPFGALDEQTRMILADELINIWSQLSKTVIFVTHGLTEAVYLAKRVAVMTFRPGKIKNVINVDLPRPRQFTDPEFRDCLETIWGQLKEESLKGTMR